MLRQDQNKVTEVGQKTITNEIIQIIASVLALEKSQITLDSSIQNTFNWDSLNHLRILTAIEAKYGCMLKIEEISTVESVRDWVEIIQRYQRGSFK